MNESRGIVNLLGNRSNKKHILKICFLEIIIGSGCTQATIFHVTTDCRDTNKKYIYKLILKPITLGSYFSNNIPTFHTKIDFPRTSS